MLTRTEYCGNLRSYHVGQQVILYGWVNKVRNLGKIIFIDMRDREGLVQVLFNLNTDNTNYYKLAYKLRNEFCIQIIGTVYLRNKKNINKEIATGEVEVLATELTIINSAEKLPLDFNQVNTKEARLKYRYLDLRNEKMTKILKTRAKITSFVRSFMEKNGFLDIETPILIKTTPEAEGAKNFLVPSRIYKGKYYALPQSPQLFKQMLMISGFDRYYQIVKCFRDEDLRSDRQPEFTQIDIETSFMSAQQLREILETMIRNLWFEIKGIDLGKFIIMTFAEAKLRFGSDKPDLRNPMELIDINDLFTNIELGIFLGTTQNSKVRVAALKVPGGASISCKNIDYYSQFVKSYGAKKLEYIKVNEYAKGLKGINSPIVKIINKKIIEQIINRTKALDGDIIFIIADNNKVVTKALGNLRLKLGKDLSITDKNKWKPLWIIDFPMFKSDEKGVLTPMHHPFTSPINMSVKELKAAPETAIANSYDMVINGYEVGGGSVRIHNCDMQQTVFSIIGINKKEQRDKFGFLLEALKLGSPPHAGIALGLDRITMLLTETDNISDVIAFPKTTAAACLMTGAPSLVTN